ncbi:hypothetical protein IWW38_000336 [Coemansia aciculifera]|uniref:Uncharacterized protein n=1 Tax=Coemansia aciculifera TaxID=417176 RepID=A0ACC1MB83_9FUNG|nr:hypothetical protein IWW38_000336 [Coemansia aciculifera]
MRGVQRYHLEIKPAPPVIAWALFSGLTSFIAMSILGMITKYGAAIKDHHLPFAIAPAGASAVLLYGVPSAPLSQPRNVLVGHMIAAVIGTFMNQLFIDSPESLRWLPGALAVGISIALMGLTNCYHPPAGATAYLAGFYSADYVRVGWWFALYPVLPVFLIMISVALILNNLARVYPVYWFTAVPMASIIPLAEQKTNVAQIPVQDEESLRSSVDACGASQVDDHIENEGDADSAWMAARIHELEHELYELRAKQHRDETARLQTPHSNVV